MPHSIAQLYSWPSKRLILLLPWITLSALHVIINIEYVKKKNDKVVEVFGVVLWLVLMLSRRAGKKEEQGILYQLLGVCVCARALVWELGPQVISIGQHTAYILYINIPKHDCTCTHTHTYRKLSVSLNSKYVSWFCLQVKSFLWWRLECRDY